jgi:hypothetical protein
MILKSSRLTAMLKSVKRPLNGRFCEYTNGLGRKLDDTTNWDVTLIV